MAKVNKSQLVRDAIALKRNENKTAVELAKELSTKTVKIPVNLIYSVRWQAKGGKVGGKGKKAKNKASRGANGHEQGGILEAGTPVAAPVSTAQPTLTSMITTLQEALVVLNRVRGIVG